MKSKRPSRMAVALAACILCVLSCGCGGGGTFNDSIDSMFNTSAGGGGGSHAPLKIVYLTADAEGDNQAIRSIRLDGTDEKTLDASTEGLSYLNASGSHGKAVYTKWASAGNPNSSEVYVVNTDGTGDARLTDNINTEMRAYVSGDGAKIYFSRTVYIGENVEYGLFSMKTDGSGETQIAGGTTNKHYFSMSQDGSVFAYLNSPGAGRKLYAYDTASATETLVLEIPVPYYIGGHPAVSPDGLKIGYTSGCGAGFSLCRSIGIRSKTGQELFLLELDSAGFIQYLAWSPDSGKLAFTGPSGVYVYDINADTNTLIRGHDTLNNYFYMLMDWSDDGQYILAAKVDLENETSNAVYFKPDGSGETNITDYSTDTQVNYIVFSR